MELEEREAKIEIAEPAEVRSEKSATKKKRKRCEKVSCPTTKSRVTGRIENQKRPRIHLFSKKLSKNARFLLTRFTGRLRCGEKWYEVENSRAG
jgi:hypothetical protein